MTGFCLHLYKGSNFEKMNFRPIPNHWGHKKDWRVMSATSSQWFSQPCLPDEAALETQVFRSQVFWSNLHRGMWGMQKMLEEPVEASRPLSCSVCLARSAFCHFMLNSWPGRQSVSLKFSEPPRKGRGTLSPNLRPLRW